MAHGTPSTLYVSQDGRRIWGRMYTCMQMAESLHCSLETITIVNQLYPNIKQKVKKENYQKYIQLEYYSTIKSNKLLIHAEKEMATHSSILAWRILWTEEPGGLLSIESDTTEMTQQQQQLDTCNNQMGIMMNEKSKSYRVIYCVILFI